MSPGERVALRRGGWEGKVERVQGLSVHVAFDHGGTGIFPVDDLVSVPREDKAWPPRTIETK